MDEKSRKNELIEFFFSKFWNIPDPNIECEEAKSFEFELNGWEGLIVWAPNGLFYQMNYKGPDIWSITMFPYDIYGERKYVEGEWHEKRI